MVLTHVGSLETYFFVGRALLVLGLWILEMPFVLNNQPASRGQREDTTIAKSIVRQANKQSNMA